MSLTSWDPLSTTESDNTEILDAARKRGIRNILKSYVGRYDPFSELIQNAMDAVDKMAAQVDNDGFQPTLSIEVDLQENSFSITDNGVGFNEREFRLFLAPDISFKTGQNTRGNKGVGATYIGYGFNYLQFGTKREQTVFEGELANGRNWVDDKEAVITRPVVNPTIISSDSFEKIQTGSYFKIKFGGGKTRPKDLSWYTATTAKQWSYLLLLRTPLGAITLDGSNKSQIKFNLKVRDKSGTETTVNDEDAHYIFPHATIKASVNLKDVIAAQEKLIASGKDASAIPNKYFKSNGVYLFFDSSEVAELRPSDAEFVSLTKEYDITAYAYFTYSTAVWDQFNDVKAKLRKGYRVLRGGLQLANNGMTQGELIAIPLTSNIGYQNQCHIIVHFKNADPDLGRKGFQPELKGVAEKISVTVVNRLKKWKKLLKADSGVKPDIEKETQLHDWIKFQEKHETDNPLSLDNPNFFAPINEISISSLPQSEQDVIVLFNQLIAGGVIRGIKLLATSSYAQYDGVFRYDIKEPFDNHVYNEHENPLGVEELHVKKTHLSAPKILEYKYSMDALIREFENEEKFAKDISLVVVWDLGNEWRKNYDVVSLLDLENLHQRDFHGLTHTLTSGTNKLHVIVLKEMIEFLNDVQGVQNFHKTEYGDDLFD